MEITELNRRNLLKELLRGDLLPWGEEAVELLGRVWNLEAMPSTDPRHGNAREDIWRHTIANDDWEPEYLYLDYVNLRGGQEEKLFRFLEALVAPDLASEEEQRARVEVINSHLKRDGYQLKVVTEVSGYPVYEICAKGKPSRGQPRNLIFAANGPKPEIVVHDALDNEIRIVANQQYCLVYDRPIGAAGLRWTDLVDWWRHRTREGGWNNAEAALEARLLASMQSSPPERVLFSSYQHSAAHLLGTRMPALVPQVYLHLDPYTVRERQGQSLLLRQRMDFLLLLPQGQRVVIEVDGKQHYAIGDKASPPLYAKMVAEDRRLRLAGYEVYRFGGAELTAAKGPELVATFLSDLFTKHGLLRESG